MTKRLLAYVVIASGLSLRLFFANYSRHFIPFPYPVIIGYLGYGVLLIGFYLLTKSHSSKERKAIRKAEKYIADIKQRGEEIQVDLSKCELKGENDQTVLIYKCNYNGKEEKFVSPVIRRTIDDLRIKVYLVKTTSLYVDKNDRSKYYFDLDFLNRS